jgi:microcystin-dependent protein
MTQAINLANFSNSLDSSGQLAPSVLNAPVPYSKGGTAATTQAAAQANMGVITGEIKMWGVVSPPTGYLICNGAAVSRSTYAALFAVYGSTFGSGDGSTTFNLPDFRDRMPIGAGSTYSLAATGGSATTTLSTANIPSHAHSFSATTAGMNSNTSHNHNLLGSSYHYVADGGQNNGGASANPFTPGSTTYGDVTATTSIDHTHNLSGTTGSIGSGTAATTISPYLGIYYIVKT